MKIVKYLFFLLLIAIIAGAVYVSTIDGAYQIEESKIINAPDKLVFSTINEYKTWEKWGPWMDESDDLQLQYATLTSGRGASYSWTSEIQGDGKMLTEKVAKNKSIDQKMTIISPMGESFSDVYWKFEKIDAKKTKVTWGMKGEQSFMEKAFWATQDSTLSQMVKPMYARGLEKIEAFVNEEMKKYTIKIEGVTEHKGGFYMYSATTSSIPEIPEKITQMLPVVTTYMDQNSLPQTGTPFVLYNEYNEELGTSIFSVAVPTQDKVETPKENTVLCDVLPSQKVVKTIVKGHHTNLKEAWENTYKYISENNLEPNIDSPGFEVYITDGKSNPNPAEWITEIYIPIK
ncbi:SRPBCC family protein [Aquimarina algicola]|uniref:AraC family transcriptional regulator n=1 Tax=Aquimarina algicola TaxID=2589995 RepID=A0A504J9X4_9FLAO|nr:GyrI-like domain-containing protein [Aquimarina algicola]TPN84668.1 AraC family transcriptional regulator [Aquimarina algicola]